MVLFLRGVVVIDATLGLGTIIILQMSIVLGIYLFI